MSEEIRVNELQRYHPKKYIEYYMYKRVEPEPIPGTEAEIADGVQVRMLGLKRGI